MADSEARDDAPGGEPDSAATAGVSEQIPTAQAEAPARPSEQAVETGASSPPSETGAPSAQPTTDQPPPKTDAGPSDRPVAASEKPPGIREGDASEAQNADAPLPADSGEARQAALDSPAGTGAGAPRSDLPAAGIGSPRRPGSLAPDSSTPDVVLISDPSAEGETIATMLRARGYVVVDAPVALLEARVLGEPARVLIVDVDQAGAFESLERLRELGAGASLDLICIGDPVRAAELGVPRSSGRAFERPLDFDEVLDQVASVADPAVGHHVRGTTPPPSYAPRRETAPPVARDSDVPAASEFPRAGDPFDVGAILPALDPDSPGPKLPTQLSPELEQLLSNAEQKVLATIGRTSSVPSPEEEVDLILSPELLAVLDEPLEPEEEGDGTGSGLVRDVAPGLPHSSSEGTGTGTGNVGETGIGKQTGTGSDVVEMTGTDAAWPRPATRSATSVIDEPPLFETGTSTRGFDDQPPTELLDAVALNRVRTPVPRPLEPDIQLRPEVGDLFGAGAPRPMSQVALARDEWLEPRATGFVDRTVHEPPARPSAAERQLARAASTEHRPSSTGPAHAPQPSRPVASDHLRPEADEPIPAVLAEGGAVVALGAAIGRRASGSLAMAAPEGVRRIVLHEGDIVTAGSGVAEETLVSFLAARGDLDRELAGRLAGRLPPFGRHAGAALIAYGHLGQEDLWPVLRAHAEWVIGRALCATSGTCELETEPPGRLKAEPSVFGGAAGAEVLVETVRRVVSPVDALARLGGDAARVDEGKRTALLGECAVRAEEEEVLRAARGQTVGELLAALRAASPQGAGEHPTLVYALAALDILHTFAPTASREAARASSRDPLDDEAVRQRVRARLALVQDGDYFAVLGLPRSATSYEIRRAYLELRRGFEPTRLLTAATADLAEDLRTVVDVIDEAYEILREPHRRERYRRAIEIGPPD